MSEKQMDFLDELASLFRKYEIDEMSVVNGGDGRIDFISHGQRFSVGYFEKGEFRSIRSFRGSYKPQEQEVNR